LLITSTDIYPFFRCDNIIVSSTMYHNGEDEDILINFTNNTNTKSTTNTMIVYSNSNSKINGTSTTSSYVVVLCSTGTIT